MTNSTPPSDSPRRPTRIRTQIPIRVRSLETVPGFSEDCHTLVVNLNGCGVRLRRPLEPGCRVILENLPGGNQAPAAVANCIPLGKDGKYWLLGIALDEPGNVWCIYPVPADWGDLPMLASPVPLRTSGSHWPYSAASSSKT